MLFAIDGGNLYSIMNNLRCFLWQANVDKNRNFLIFEIHILIFENIFKYKKIILNIRKYFQILENIFKY